MEAQDLTDSLNRASDQISKHINYAAIGLSELDYEDFVQGKYFEAGKIYLDLTKETYKALGFGSKGIFSLFGMANPMVYFKAYEAKNKGISGNMKGDGTLLGGTVILDRDGNIIFSHKQKDYVDQPNSEDMIEAVKNYVENMH